MIDSDFRKQKLFVCACLYQYIIQKYSISNINIVSYINYIRYQLLSTHQIVSLKRSKQIIKPTISAIMNANRICTSISKNTSLGNCLSKINPALKNYFPLKSANNIFSFFRKNIYNRIQIHLNFNINPLLCVKAVTCYNSQLSRLKQ